MLNISTILNDIIKRPNFLIIFFTTFFNFTTLSCQTDSTRLSQLIIETNEEFLSIFAHGILLSPYERLEFNRCKTIKNIEMVDAIEFYRFFSNKKDTIPFVVKDNQTIITKPEERFNSKTYVYHKGGRIQKIYRGRHINDLFLTDDDGFLIQHGNGGELKKAKRRKNTVEWYNVKKDRLEYTISYNDQSRPISIKTMGHHFGLNVEYEIENYTWNENQIATQTTVLHYKQGGNKSTFIKFEYNDNGTIKTISTREGEKDRWSSTNYSTEIEKLDFNSIKITILHDSNEVLSITYDQHDNWTEMLKFSNTYKRDIKYRKKKRRK